MTMMTMDAVVDTLKYALLGVNAVLFVALVVTLVTARPAAAPEDQHSSDRAAKRALLVTAHPDDESMFFLPLVHSLTAAQRGEHREWELHLLCLSRGNFDGLGAVREKEMHVCGEFLGLKRDHIHVLEDAKLQDGMREQWGRDHVAQVVLQYIDKHAVDAVFTFDDYGISGHPNHIDVHFGVKRAVEEQHRRCAGDPDSDDEKKAKPVRGWALESVNILRKYIGVLDAAVMPSVFGRGGDSVFVFLFRPWWNYSAMALHYSQFVWYRRLFVVFSRYTFINTFKPLVKMPELSTTADGSQKKTQ